MASIQRANRSHRKVLYVAVGSDCDPDREAYGGTPYDTRDELHWDGVTEGCRKARELADQVALETGTPIRFTWCVRSDDQMHKVYGDYAWGYRGFSDHWSALTATGDELAWHAHLWRWDDQLACWYQETEDEAWATDCLSEGYEALRRELGSALRTSRMGWEYHNDHTMRTVAAFSLENDFSAIPGWYTPGERSSGSKFHCRSDWRSSPDQPFVPSRDDYRQAADTWEDALPIREYPMSTFRSAFWNGLRTVKNAVRERGPVGMAQALCPGTWNGGSLKAYVTIKPMIFQRLVSARLKELRHSDRGHELLITAFHPDELLEDGDGKLYSSGNFEANLRTIIQQADAAGVQPVFTTISGLSNIAGLMPESVAVPSEPAYQTPVATAV